MRKSSKPSNLVVIAGIGSALFLASQSLQGAGGDVLSALWMSAVVMAWWSFLQPRKKAGSPERQPARPAKPLEDAHPAGLPETSDPQDLWVVLQVDVPPPEFYQRRLQQLERTLEQAQRMQVAGAPVEPLVLSLLHEEIRYLRVMVSLSQEVLRKRGRP